MDDKTKAMVEQVRQELSETKGGCVEMFHTEFKEINWSAFAEKHFDRTSSWIQKKFTGCILPNKEKPFTEDEYKRMSEVLRSMAERLDYYANLIDKAK